MAAITAAMDLTHQALSPARREVVERGLAWVPGRGRLAFTVPGFADWVVRTRPDAATWPPPGDPPATAGGPVSGGQG